MELTQEEKQARQVKLTELMGQFKPARYNFVGKPEEVINFSFTYEGETPIQAVEPGCSGCTKLSCKDNVITGTLTLDPKERYTPSGATNGESSPVNKVIQVWFEDGEDWYVVNEDLQRFPNPKKISVPLYLSGQVDLR